MNALIAKGTAIVTGFLALSAVAAVYVTSKPDLLRGGHEVGAQFEDAYPLLEGMHVRVDGAVAGTVKDISLGEGKANITMQLFDGTKVPRSDAIATIRPEDITGDTYVSLTMGAAPDLLTNECDSDFVGEIPCVGTADTMNAPRFDDLLNAFNQPVRQGLEILFVQLGRTLEGRGEDVNTAALGLRDGIAAADTALAEVNSQNDALGLLVADAANVTGQAAAREQELGTTIDSFAATVNTTAEHLPALDEGLARAPEVIGRARGTLAKLSATTGASLPLARTVADAAPQLAVLAARFGPFLDDAILIIDDVEPTLDLVRKLLVASLPTLKASPKRVFTAPFDLTAALGALLNTLVGDPTLIDSLFSADCYGGRVAGCDSSDDFGLGAVAVQGGNAAGFPTNDPERFFVRASAVPSCETFGVPIGPGCLEDVLLNLDNLVGFFPLSSAQRQPARTRGGTASPAPPVTIPSLVPDLPRALGALQKKLPIPGLPKLGKGKDKGKDRGKDKDKDKGGSVADLLEFLLGP